MRPKGATGSQGLRIIHSAIPAIYKRIFLIVPSISFYSDIHTKAALFHCLAMDPKQFLIFGTQKTTKAKHLNHKSNQVVRRLQEVENNGEMSTLRQRGCLTLQMFLLQRILLRRASPPRKPCVPRILESKSTKGRGTANHCRKRAYETIIQVYHHLRPPTHSKSLLVQHKRTQTLSPRNVARLGRRLILHPI